MTDNELNARTNLIFWERTGYKPGRVLDPGDRKDREMMKAWLAIRAELTGRVEPAAPTQAPRIPTSRTPLYLAIALVGATGIIAVQNRRRIRRAAGVAAAGAKKAAAGARRATARVKAVARKARSGARDVADRVRQLTRADPEPEDERTFMEKYGAQYRAKHGGGGRRRLALPPGEAA